jgi:hypothetical protein
MTPGAKTKLSDLLCGVLNMPTAENLPGPKPFAVVSAPEGEPETGRAV